jgi:hypothetical protein
VSGGASEFRSAFRLETEVQLTDVVEGGQHAQTSPIGGAQLAAGELGETPLPYGEAEQSLRHRSDVCAVVD